MAETVVLSFLSKGKGGVGRSTGVAGFASTLVKFGFRGLVLDLDHPTANLTSWFRFKAGRRSQTVQEVMSAWLDGVSKKEPYSMGELKAMLLGDEDNNIRPIIFQPAGEGFYLLPGSGTLPDLQATVERLAISDGSGYLSSDYMLAQILASVSDAFDFILIDGPQTGIADDFIIRQILNASTHVVIPMGMSNMDFKAAVATVAMVDGYISHPACANPELQIGGVYASRVAGNNATFNTLAAAQDSAVAPYLLDHYVSDSAFLLSLSDTGHSPWQQAETVGGKSKRDSRKAANQFADLTGDLLVKLGYKGTDVDALLAAHKLQPKMRLTELITEIEDEEEETNGSNNESARFGGTGYGIAINTAA